MHMPMRSRARAREHYIFKKKKKKNFLTGAGSDILSVCLSVCLSVRLSVRLRQKKIKCLESSNEAIALIKSRFWDFLFFSEKMGMEGGLLSKINVFFAIFTSLCRIWCWFRKLYLEYLKVLIFMFFGVKIHFFTILCRIWCRFRKH